MGPLAAVMRNQTQDLAGMTTATLLIVYIVIFKTTLEFEKSTMQIRAMINNNNMNHYYY